MQLAWRFFLVVGLFAGFARDFLLLAVQKRWFGQDKLEAKYHRLYRSQAIRFRQRAVALGGLLVKLGQFFSAHIEILPAEYIEELGRLQDEVPALPFTIIGPVIEQELGGNALAYLDPEPLAAASLGQVYRAKLLSGSEVAVKVLRPGIERIIRLDLRALRFVLFFVRRFTSWGKTLDVEAVYQEFKQTLLRELDYLEEGRSAERFAGNFAGNEQILVPGVHWEHTTRRVLTLEFMPGQKIDRVIAAGGAESKRQLAAKLFQAYLDQFLVHGFFHADPHPGNLLIQDDGRIAFIDFGMVGEVGPGLMDDVRGMAMAVVKQDSRAMVDAFERLGFLRSHADKDTLQQAVDVVFQRSSGGGTGSFMPEQLAEDIRELLSSQPFQLPANVIFMGKALITVMGLCGGLDPEFNPFTGARPYLEKLVGAGDKGKAAAGARGVFQGLTAQLRLLASLPDKIERAAREMERLPAQNRKLWRQQVEYQRLWVNRIVYSLLLAAFSVAYVFLPPDANGYLLKILVGLIALLACGLVGNFRRERRLERGRRADRLRQGGPKF